MKKHLTKRNIIIFSFGIITILIILGIVIFLTEIKNKVSCNTSLIKLRGTIVTYIPENSDLVDYVSSEDIVNKIEEANDNDDIKYIIIETDSSGGSTVGGEEIVLAIKESPKPVFAYIRELGSSSAYWSISSADKIFASRNSTIGSIGVTASYLSNYTKNSNDGLKYERIVSGEYKDIGSPDKILTNKEKNILQRDVDIIYNYFVEQIAENRQLSIEKVKSFSDGSNVLGDKALELGLIDYIGNLSDVKYHIYQESGEWPEVCWE